MYKNIRLRCEALSQNFKEIPEQRKSQLENLSSIIRKKLADKKEINLIFVCTHNSRRSHLGQVWAKVSAEYYGYTVNTFSAGTEATAFHDNARKALENAGFMIKAKDDSQNPLYEVQFGDNKSCLCFSKTIDHESLPKENAIAVMTCGDADENCPHIPSCDKRIGITYFDPKAYDNSILQDEKYTERSNQIAMEFLYVFSKI